MLSDHSISILLMMLRIPSDTILDTSGGVKKSEERNSGKMFDLTS